MELFVMMEIMFCTSAQSDVVATRHRCHFRTDFLNSWFKQPYAASGCKCMHVLAAKLSGGGCRSGPASSFHPPHSTSVQFVHCGCMQHLEKVFHWFYEMERPLTLTEEPSAGSQKTWVPVTGLPLWQVTSPVWVHLCVWAVGMLLTSTLYHTLLWD